MLKVIVHWSKDIPVEQLQKHRERNNEHLYLILRKHTLSPMRRYRPMYIGMAYRQSVYRRLKNHHKLKHIVKQQFGLGKIVVRIGQIQLPNKHRISQDLVDDIESVLIINEQTRYNTVSRKRYRGRPIAITNRGRYRPLHRRVNSVNIIKRLTVSGIGLFVALALAVAILYFAFTDSGYRNLVKWVDYAMGQITYWWNTANF